MFIKISPGIENKKLKVDSSKTEKARALLKAISWRAIGTSDTFIISYFITGYFTWAASIATLEVFTKTGLYYLHERGWQMIKFGRAGIQ